MKHKVEGEEKKAPLFYVYLMNAELSEQLCHKMRFCLSFLSKKMSLKGSCVIKSSCSNKMLGHGSEGKNVYRMMCEPH